MTSVHLLAEAAAGGTSGIDVFSPVLSTGVVGAVLLLIMFRKLLPFWVHEDALKQRDAEIERLRADLAEAKAAVKESNAVYASTVVPTLTRVVDLLRTDGARGGP